MKNDPTSIWQQLRGVLALCALTVLSLGALLAVPGQYRQTITLEWDYPTNELSTSLVFKIYSSTNLATPLTNWPVLAIVPGTNTTAVVANDGRYRWFVMTASNWWGETPFSNVTNPPSPLPRYDNNLRVGP